MLVLQLLKKHFTILNKNETKDGVVSVNAKQLSDLVKLSNLSTSDRKKYIKENIKEFEIMLGNERRELSHEELLNRDYYRGRFASKDISGKVIYNWEEANLNNLV